MMEKHTPGPWAVGKEAGGCVVANRSHSEVNGREQDDDMMDFYGGFLIAESIEPRNLGLIAAAPTMLAGLEAAATYATIWRTGIRILNNDRLDEIEKLISEAIDGLDKIIANAKGES